MKPIIRVENLSKQYRIGTERASYGTLRDSLTNTVTAPFRRFSKTDHRPPTTDHPDTIWALKDINFEVMPGEVVGIIGHNGAGKSTLLKILSRITEPTEGKVDLYGRVGSLLEVGTGFHAELSGKENIYLNGAILGMRRSEIDRKFEEIITFAEVEKFIDTPVKRYSSGMYLRLAFAVAAHLNPEILIVDEVLAVGDAQFQKKCLNKLEDAAIDGRTILFVSHDMSAISHLCTKGIVLADGREVFYGSAEAAVNLYNHKSIEGAKGHEPHVLYEVHGGSEDRGVAVTKVEILDTSGKPKPVISTWDDAVLRLWFYSNRYVKKGSVVIEITTLDGSRLLMLSTQPDGTLPLTFSPGYQCVECLIEKIPFASGEYIVGAGLALPKVEWLWRERDLCRLTIVARDVYGSGLAPTASRALVAVKHDWRLVS